MAIILDTSVTNNIQILGQLPSDSLGDVIIDLVSNYDGLEYRVLGTGANEGKWIVVTIDGADLPDFSGLYVSSIATSVQRPLSLSDITQSLSEITDTLLTLFGPAVGDILTERLHAQINGQDTVTVTENSILITTTEHIIPTDLVVSYSGLTSGVMEYNIEAGEDATYTGTDDSRITYHR